MSFNYTLEGDACQEKAKSEGRVMKPRKLVWGTVCTCNRELEGGPIEKVVSERRIERDERPSQGRACQAEGTFHTMAPKTGAERVWGQGQKVTQRHSRTNHGGLRGCQRKNFGFYSDRHVSSLTGFEERSDLKKYFTFLSCSVNRLSVREARGLLRVEAEETGAARLVIQVTGSGGLLLGGGSGVDSGRIR